MELVSPQPRSNVYRRIGGLPAFDKLVEAFYTRVKQDPTLAPMFPEDMAEPRRHLALFLAQFFGGPNDYSLERGHPRLRSRHLLFRIGRAERDAWLAHMLAAIEDAGIQEPALSEMRKYFDEASEFMINQ